MNLHSRTLSMLADDNPIGEEDSEDEYHEGVDREETEHVRRIGVDEQSSSGNETSENEDACDPWHRDPLCAYNQKRYQDLHKKIAGPIAMAIEKGDDRRIPEDTEYIWEIGCKVSLIRLFTSTCKLIFEFVDSSGLNTKLFVLARY